MMTVKDVRTLGTNFSDTFATKQAVKTPVAKQAIKTPIGAGGKELPPPKGREVVEGGRKCARAVEPKILAGFSPRGTEIE